LNKKLNSTWGVSITDKDGKTHSLATGEKGVVNYKYNTKNNKWEATVSLNLTKSADPEKQKFYQSQDTTAIKQILTDEINRKLVGFGIDSLGNSKVDVTTVQPISTSDLDGGEFRFGDGLHWYEWGSVLCDAASSIYETTKMPGTYWNKDEEGRDDYPVHVPPTVCGVGDAAIEEALSIPVLVKFGLEIVTDKEKAKGLWESVKNISWSSIRDLAVDTYNEKKDAYTSEKPYIVGYTAGYDAVQVAFIATGVSSFAKGAGDVLEKGIKETGEKVKNAIKKKLDDIESFMKTPDFTKLLDDAWGRYKGKLSRAKWEEKYKTLYKNREKGAITESKFEELMGGEPHTFTVKGEVRKVDNLVDKTAKEIKSGELKITDFTDNQLKKDIDMLLDDRTPVNKIEWHLFGGIDNDAKKLLETLRNIHGKDKFDFIIY
jgi:hypothetical protein